MKLLHLLLLFAAAIAVYFWLENRHRNKAIAEIESSNGTFDEHAQAAFEQLNKIQWSKPKDRFLAARVVDLNGHDGRIHNVRVFNDVLKRYTQDLHDREWL